MKGVGDLFVNSLYGEDYVAWIGVMYDFNAGIYVNTLGEEQLYFNWNPTFQNPIDSSYGDVNTTIILQCTSPYVRFEGAWDDSWENQPVPYCRKRIAEIPLNLSANLPSERNEGESFVLNIDLTTEVSGTTYTEGARVWY